MTLESGLAPPDRQPRPLAAGREVVLWRAGWLGAFDRV
jgi:hypothetical protein